MQVFAPLARLLGLYSIKEELEELSFRFSEPENAARLAAQVATMRAAQAAGVCKARSMLQDALDGDPYLASCVERVDVEQQHKALYSIWRCARAIAAALCGGTRVPRARGLQAAVLVTSASVDVDRQCPDDIMPSHSCCAEEVLSSTHTNLPRLRTQRAVLVTTSLAYAGSWRRRACR